MDETMNGEIMSILGYTSDSIALTAVENSSMIMIVGIYIALTSCQDYSQQTMKTIYARGCSRTKVYFGKLLTSLCSLTIMFVAVFVWNWLLGSIFFGFTLENFGRVILLAGGQYLTCVAFLGLYFMFVHLIRKMGAVLALSLIVPMAVELVLIFVDIFAMQATEEFTVSSFWLSGFITKLSSMSVSSGWIIGVYLGAIAYSALFFGLGYLASRRAEL